MKRLSFSILLLGILGQAGNAIADSSSYVKIDWSSFDVQIIDWSDGANVPVFSWNPAVVEGHSFSTARTAPFDKDLDGPLYAEDFVTTLSTAAYTSHGQSSSTRSETTLLATASSQINDIDPEGTWPVNYGISVASNTLSFTVTGYGEAVFSLNWEMGVTGNAGDSNDYGVANASVLGDYGDGLYSDSFYSEMNLSSSDFGSGSKSGTFSWTVFSPGGETTAYMLVLAGANAFSPAAPVPEPQTYAMLLAGLGLVGWAARGRRTKRIH